MAVYQHRETGEFYQTVDGSRLDVRRQNDDDWQLVEGGQEQAPEAVPNRSDTKDVWVDYAVTQGADRDEAESATKDQLVDEYGG